MYQKREKNRHELFLLSSKNHITFLDRATVMRQKTNGIHICLSALKTRLAVPDEMIFMARTGLGRPFNFLFGHVNITGKVAFVRVLMMMITCKYSEKFVNCLSTETGNQS